MRRLYQIFFVLGAVAMTACHNNSRPNYQYMPNMYESAGYETYSASNAFKNGKEGQLPPDGTINRGFEIYAYPNTTEGYNDAKANSKSPLDSTDVDMDKAKELFEIYCAICHGNAGDGKGKLVKQEKFLGVPNYKDRQITEGSVFHVETFGLNAMGSYANQLTAHERWMVAMYVMKLRGQ